jgi:hypothetical protein
MATRTLEKQLEEKLQTVVGIAWLIRDCQKDIRRMLKDIHSGTMEYPDICASLVNIKSIEETIKRLKHLKTMKQME